MATTRVKARIDGAVDVELSIGYDIIGKAGRTWVITPGGRFSRHYPGVRELALDLAALGNRVLIWDRPNTGESDVCFAGSSESGMQGDVLAALISDLGLAPAVLIGGSGGARVSVLAGARHRDVSAGLGLWWITGGVYGLMRVGTNYGGQSPAAAWKGGMEAVVALPEWAEVLEKNPSNRQRFLDLDPAAFIETIERWMLVHCPCDSGLIPGLPDSEVRALDVPAVVFRSSASDPVHTRVTSERVAGLLPGAKLVDPPWPDTDPLDAGHGRLFLNWPLLAPILHEWARAAVAR